MLFLFKEKPVEITAFVTEEFHYVTQYNPIGRASEFIPNWYKKMASPEGTWDEKGYMIKNAKGKGCIGILKTFQNGYILPMWCDGAFDITATAFRCHFSDEITYLSLHDNSQLPNFFENYLFAKIHSPWVLRSSEDIKMVYTEPTFFTVNRREYFVPSGILPSINKYLSTNTFLFLERTPRDFIIPNGDPLLHIIPMTDKPTKLRIEVTTKNDWFNKSRHPSISFVYDAIKKLKKLRKNQNK